MSSPDTNSTAMANATGDVALGSNATAATSASQAVGLFDHFDHLVLTAQITVSAMTIIWLGANSSLRRPPSAAPAKAEGKDKGKKPKEDGFSEGFVASDAIMVPVLAGTVLIGLYYLIKWMQDPDLLNKILRAYMSVMSVASLGKLSADTLHLLTSLTFPNIWSDRNGRLFQMDTVRRRQVLMGAEGAADATANDRKTPFPSILSRLSLSAKMNRAVWEIRHLFIEEWSVRMAFHGVGSGKVNIMLNDILGFVVALLVTMAYFMTGWVWLSNILGAAFCYAAFTMVSPTSFLIGTMVLAGLFVYDIVMVFYTPYMITVATKLDVPIKLVFQGPSRSSILGLGDIVVPGIFIALALRFDLWRHYNKQITSVPTELKTEFSDKTSKEAVTTTQTKDRHVKVPFVDPRGRWGDRVWSARRLTSIFSAPTATSALAATAFSKTYFYASMAGYALGMLLTLTVMLVFNHGQPALLYLVPCVAGAVWLTGAARGEIHDMLTYTEDGSLDTKDVVVEVDASGKAIEETSEKAAERGELNADSTAKTPRGAEESTIPEATAQPEEQGSREDAASVNPDGSYDVFLFSITAPGPASLKVE